MAHEQLENSPLKKEAGHTTAAVWNPYSLYNRLYSNLAGIRTIALDDGNKPEIQHLHLTISRK